MISWWVVGATKVGSMPASTAAICGSSRSVMGIGGTEVTRSGMAEP